MSKKINALLALTSGVLLVLSFPPLNLYFLAWFSLLPFLYSLQGKGVKESFYAGIICGFTYFLGTVYWVSHSMHVYGNLAAPVTLSVLVLLCLYLSLYVGLFGALFNFISDKTKLPAALFAPLIWVPLELMRSYALTGFPWALIGYSQSGFLSIIQVADITGIYGVSFLIIASNGMLYDVIVYRAKTVQWPLAGRWLLIVSITFTAIVISTAVVYGKYRLHQGELPAGLTVSVVQGNIPQDQKWDPRFQKEVIDKYQMLTETVNAEDPALIVWPESALPFTFGVDETLTEETVQFQKKLGTYLLLGGVVVRESEFGKRKLANSAILLSPEGQVQSVYDKIHLVPFGEYVPLKKLFPFIDKIVVAIGDFVEGDNHVIMKTPFASIGSVICYEIIFPDLVREFVRNGADLLVTITNDAWFGRTSAPYQHFSMAVFRAIENRVPVVRSANTGISGFIDEKGRVLSQSDIFVEAAMTEVIAPGNKKSFYTQHGDIFAYACVSGLVLLIVSTLIYGKDSKR